MFEYCHAKSRQKRPEGRTDTEEGDAGGRHSKSYDRCKPLFFMIEGERHGVDKRTRQGKARHQRNECGG
ncbi:hypothetical protein D9M69_621950 [compost metagenome]